MRFAPLDSLPRPTEFELGGGFEALRVGQRGLARLGMVATVGALFAGPSSAAAEEVSAGSLRAKVSEDPWGVSFVDQNDRPVLDEHPGTGPGASGTLGFRAAGVWRHATRVISSSRDGEALVAELATTDPLRRMEVRLEPDAEGVIRLGAKVLGPTAGRRGRPLLGISAAR